MSALVEVLDAFDNVEPVAYAHAARPHRLLHVVVSVVLGLACMVHFLEVEVGPLLYDFVANPDVGFHGAVGVLLLHEVDADHPFPLVGASLVEPVEVALLSVELEAEEDEAGGEVGVLSLDCEVDLVEGLHERALVVLLEEVALAVVLGQLDKQCAELHPLVPVPDVLQQHVPHVLLEDVQREDQHEEAPDLLLEQHPELVLRPRHHSQLLLLEHGDVGHEMD